MGGPGAARWDPWEALASRPHIQLHFDEVAALLGGALYARRGPHAVIVLDPALSPTQQRVALAHELVHDERGGGCDTPGAPASWDAVVARDEAAVNREVARRLVPAGDLAALVAETPDLSAWHVADAFDVDPTIAALALDLLASAADERSAHQGVPSPADVATRPGRAP